MSKYFLMLIRKLLICRFLEVVVTCFLRRIYSRQKGNFKPLTLIGKKICKLKNWLRLVLLGSKISKLLRQLCRFSSKTFEFAAFNRLSWIVFKAYLFASKRKIQGADVSLEKETQMKKMTLTCALSLKNFNVVKAALQILISNFHLTLAKFLLYNR